MKKNLIIAAVATLLITASFFFWKSRRSATPPDANNAASSGQSVQDMLSAINRQPAASDAAVTNSSAATSSLTYKDLVRLDSPQPNDIISSPLIVRGAARGSWFFEASFPIVLTNWDGLIIAQGVATAQGDWMTTDYVPFTAQLNFTIAPDEIRRTGSLILKKDNPSGLPAKDDALEVPINFAK